MLIHDFRAEYERYRQLAERAIAQVPDDALNAMPVMLTGARTLQRLMHELFDDAEPSGHASTVPAPKNGLLLAVRI